MLFLGRGLTRYSALSTFMAVSTIMQCKTVLLFSLIMVLWGCANHQNFDSKAYHEEELKVFNDVLPDILRHDFISGMSDSILPPPKVALGNRADTLDYYEKYLEKHTYLLSSDKLMLLNLSPVLSPLPSMLEDIVWVNEQEDKGPKGKIYQSLIQSIPYQSLEKEY
jgi:hypothetical protein